MGTPPRPPVYVVVPMASTVNVLDTSAVPPGRSVENASETLMGPEIVQVSPTETASGTAGRQRPSVGLLADAGEASYPPAAVDTEKSSLAVSPLITVTLARPILCPSLSWTATSKVPGDTPPIW